MMQKMQKGSTLSLPETNMETPKGPYKDYSPFKGELSADLGGRVGWLPKAQNAGGGVGGGG